MFERQFVVGGEPVFPPSMIFSRAYNQFAAYGAELKGYHRYYTFGAYYSLKAIIQNIRFSRGDLVLLPAYLCHTITYPFCEAGIKYDYYKLKEGLLPDLEDIDRKTTENLKAILFVDYFGYAYQDYLNDMVKSLKAKGIVVIQDAVQAWIDNEDTIYGDYCFNSVRKYAPFEASVIFSKTKLSFDAELGPISRFIIHKRLAQILRYYHLNYSLFKASSFLRLLDVANKAYHQDGIVALPRANEYMLNRLNFGAMSKQRKLVFKKLVQELKLKSVVDLPLADSTPLALPIYVQDRNEKKVALHKSGIHCPVHWQLHEEIDKKEHEYCWDLQDRELTIPVSMGFENYNQYIKKLKVIL